MSAEKNPQLEAHSLDAAAKAIGKAVGSTPSEGSTPTASTSSSKEPGEKKVPEPEAPTKAPVVKQESNAPQQKKEQMMASVNEEATKEAQKKFGKSYTELETTQQMEVLVELIKDDEGGNARILKEKLQTLSQKLKNIPSPDQWDEITQQINEVPEDIFAPKNDEEEKLLAVFDKAVPAIFVHVNEFADLYGLANTSAVDIGLALKYPQMSSGIKNLYQFGNLRISKLSNTELQKVLRDYNGRMKMITSDASGQPRPDINEGDVLSELQQLKKSLREGLSNASAPFDEKETRPIYELTEAREKQVLQHLHELQEEAERKKYKDPFDPKGTKNGAEYFKQIDEYRGRIGVTEQRRISEIINDPSYKDRDEFMRELKKNIRHVLYLLESDEEHDWALRPGFSSNERQLNEYFDLLNVIDAEEGKNMIREIDARSFEHGVFRAIRTSASPQFGEVKEFIGKFGELSDVGYFDSITQLPGFSDLYQELEKHAEDLIASEMTGKRDEILESIVTKIKTDKKYAFLRARMEQAGMEPEAALRLAERHYMITGRDGEHYKEFLHKYDLIDYVDTPEGKLQVVKPTAPMFWNFFRLLYCPEAQITFFAIGSNTKGANIDIWRNGKVVENIKSGKGVGAIVMHELMREHFSLDLDDLYSRRHKQGYLTNAWGFELLDSKYKGQYDPKLKKPDHYRTFALPTELVSVDDPTKAAGFDDLHNIWYSELEDGKLAAGANTQARQELRSLERMYLKAVVGRDFALKMGMTIGEYKSFASNLVPGSTIDAYKNHVGVVTWEAMEKTDSWDGQKKKLLDAIDKDSKWSAAQKKAVRDKLTELDKNYKDMWDKRSEYNKKVQKNAPHMKGPKSIAGIEGYEKEQFMDLSKARLDRFPHTRLLRQAEIARGNIRDHVSALTVLMKTINFVNMPSLANFNEFDVKDSTAYIPPQDAQAHVIIPAYQALRKVWEGKLPGGHEIFEIPRTRSPMGRVYHQRAMSAMETYKVGLAQVNKGNLTMEQLIAVRGGFFTHMYEELGRNFDLGMMGVIGFAVVQKQMEKLEKDAEKDG